MLDLLATGEIYSGTALDRDPIAVKTYEMQITHRASFAQTKFDPNHRTSSFSQTQDGGEEAETRREPVPVARHVFKLHAARINQRRQALVVKKYAEGLSAQEERDMNFLGWQLGMVNADEMESSLTEMARLIKSQEKIAHALEQQITAVKISSKKTSRFW
mgnify:CR=1 FL=1